MPEITINEYNLGNSLFSNRINKFVRKNKVNYLVTKNKNNNCNLIVLDEIFA